MFEGIFEAIHREMDELESKYSKGTQLSGQDLEHIDKMAHALKSLKSYEVMLTGCEPSSSYESYKRSSYRRY